MKTLLQRLKKMREASLQVASLSTVQRNQVLLSLADLIDQNVAEILKANQKDLLSIKKKKGITPAFVDRLTLNDKRLGLMTESLRQVASFKDPLDESEVRTLENGLLLKKVRSPLGVIFMIFESRPNVATEAFSLAFKAGNSLILRGGRESMKTTGKLYALIHDAMNKQGCPPDAFWGLTNPDRKIPRFLLGQKEYIDVVVPRGGDGLIQFVVETAKMPIIKNDRGMCHVYVHEDGDLTMATDIVENAKTQRPGVCNAMETVLVHEKVAREFLVKLYDRLLPHDVEWRVDLFAQKILRGRKNVKKATAKSWDTEYLDTIMNCKIVSGLEQALDHINTHGSRHSEAIITKSEEIARIFQSRVDAAAVYWNASTRFTDGFEFGLGGELGISTQKLHVRGPVGLKELTSFRWIVDGSGQVRA